jgi:hypothetical protein
MTRKTNYFFGALRAVLVALCAATVVLMTIAASVGVQEAQAKKPPKDIKTNNGVSSINSVAAWGANDQGQLGDGTTTDRHAPVKVANLSGIKAIDGGAGHSLALTTSGKVWAWGDNEYGQLGDGTTTDRHVPFQNRAVSGVVAVAAGFYHSLAG